MREAGSREKPAKNGAAENPPEAVPVPEGFMRFKRRKV